MEFESYTGEGITIPEIVSDAADKHGVPHNIAHSLIGDMESGYNPYAKNPKSSASGLGQIINRTGKSLGMNITGGPDDDRWHPVINADKSMEYLASLYKETGSWNKALARYGEGPKFARSVLRAAKIAATVGERIKFEPYQAQDAPLEMEFEPYISTGTKQPAIDATSETLAQFAGPAGEMVGTVIDYPRKVVSDVLEKGYAATIEKGRPGTIKEYEEALKTGATEIAPPEALAPLPTAKEFAESVSTVGTPWIYGGLNKLVQIIYQAGRLGFYRYAPDIFFKAGAKGGLPVALTPEEITEKLMAMSGTERAEMAKKYADFRQTLGGMVGEGEKGISAAAGEAATVKPMAEITPTPAVPKVEPQPVSIPTPEPPLKPPEPAVAAREAEAGVTPIPTPEVPVRGVEAPPAKAAVKEPWEIEKEEGFPVPWQITKSEFIKQHGSKEQRESYVAKLLDKKGLGEPGLTGEPYRLGSGDYEENLLDLTYRNKDGVPVATVSLTERNGRWLIEDLGIRQDIGLLKGKVAKAIKDKLNELGVTQSLDDIVSRQAAKIWHKDSVKQAVSHGLPVPPEVLADFPELAAGPWMDVNISKTPVAAHFREGIQAGSIMEGGEVDPRNPNHIASWRSMGPKELQGLLEGKEIGGPEKAGKRAGYFSWFPGYSSNLEGKTGKPKYLVEFKGVETEFETTSRPVSIKDVSAIWKSEGKGWVRIKNVDKLLADYPDLAAKYGKGEVGAGPGRKPVYDLQKAIEQNNLGAIIKAYGGFDPKSPIIKGLEPEEQQRIRLSGLARTGAQGADALLNELKTDLPWIFKQFKDEADLFRVIAKGDVYKKIDYDKLAKGQEDYYAAIDRQADAEGLDKDGLAQVEADVAREIARERDAIQSEGGAEPAARREDYFGPEFQKPPLELTPEQIKKTYPDISDAQAEILARDPELRAQFAKGNWEALLRQKAQAQVSDEGAQRTLKGVEKGKLIYGGGPETTEAVKAVVDDTTNIIKGAPPKIKDAYEFTKEAGNKLWEWYKSPFETKERGFKGILGKYLGARQIAGFENRDFLNKIQTAVPSKVTREGITNWIQAGGDEALLRGRANKSEGTLKTGYEAAQRLTPEEKVIAAEISTRFDQYLKEAQEAGILEAGLENYVNQLWVRGAHNKTELRKLRSEINAGLLNTNFNYAKKRIFDSYFAGEQAGYIPKNKDVAFLLGTYHHSMYEAIAARRAIKAMMDGKADDGLPLVSVSGMGKQIMAPEETMPFEKVSPEYDMTEAKGPKAYLIFPKTHTESADGRRYRPIDHPALRKWKWVSNDPEGKPIFLQGDMYVHPDIYRHLKNVLGRSAIREYAVGRGALAVSQNLKGVLLSGLPTPFHQVHLGSHAIFHKINPFTCPKINFKDPIQRKAVESGLMVYSHNALAEFAEGLQPTGLAQKIPGIGRVTQAYAEYLFQDLIPRFKMKLFIEAYKRNTERYGKKYTDDQVAEITANQSNAAFGELNYKAMGRNPTMQDAFRLMALAPDFLEARLRFAGQALRPGGKEQGTALLRAIIGMYGVGIIGNMLFSDDHKPHWDKPFTAIIGKTAYSLRSVPGDIIHLINDPRSFVYHRLNPATAKPLIEALSQRDVFGRRRDMWDQIGDYFKGIVPIPLQGMVSKGERTLLQGVFQSLGVSSYKYRTATEKIMLDYQSAHKIDWSPEEAKKREPFYKDKRDLLKKTEGDKDAFETGLKELRTKFALTPRRTKNIREQFNDELKYRFDSVKDIDVAIKAYDAGTPQEKEILKRPLLKKLYNTAIRDPAKFKANNYKDKLEELRK